MNIKMQEEEFNMRNLGILILFLILITSIASIAVLAQEQIASPTNNSPQANASAAIDAARNKVREGVNETEYNIFIKDLKEKLDVINKKIQPATKIIFGIESNFSLQFIIAVLFWIILFLLIAAIVQDLFRLNSFFAHIISAIISSIILNGLGERLINVLAKSYYALFFTCIALVAILVIDLIFRLFFKKSILSFISAEKAKEIAYKKAMIRKTVDELDKEKLESYSDGGGI
jgi:hypothetical protein